VLPLVVCAALAGLPTSAAQGTAALPSDVRDVIRGHYLSPDRETRYIDGTIDLNADGQAEFLVYVAGGSACRTGGCPTLVFTHLASGFSPAVDDRPVASARQRHVGDQQRLAQPDCSRRRQRRPRA
jgi:hypothetical protein